jgi:sialic acid synthase SpsE
MAWYRHEAMTDRLTIVAEAAQGFEGDKSLARLLVRAAASGTADVVKFQLVFADEIAAPSYEYFKYFQSLEMPPEVWLQVASEARRQQVDLAFDVFGQRSLRQAVECEPVALKVHATDFFNLPLLDAVFATGLHVYLSAGGIHAREIEDLVTRYPVDALEKMTLLVGFQAEPTATGDNNLARLGAWRSRLPGIRLGFMDHAAGDADEGGWLGALALPYGVALVEKHITLDRGLKLEDYVSALDPARFARYAGRLRAAHSAIGSDDLGLTDRELAYRGKALKVAVAAVPIAAGAEVGEGDVSLLRAALEPDRVPCHGLDAVHGRRLKTMVEPGAVLYADLLA